MTTPAPMTQPACPRPCKECPWLTENHGKPHADGWYTEKNRRRLWNGGLKHGDSMSCHKTDPNNPVPEGTQCPKARPFTSAQARSCFSRRK